MQLPKDDYQPLQEQPVEGQFFRFCFTTQAKLPSKAALKLFRTSDTYFEEACSQQNQIFRLHCHSTPETEVQFDYSITYRFSQYDVGFRIVLRVEETRVAHLYIINRDPVLPS